MNNYYLFIKGEKKASAKSRCFFIYLLLTINSFFMKLLMIYCDKFSYQPQIKTLADFPDFTDSVELENVLVAFIQMEEKDIENSSKIETKLVKNLKWGAKKNNIKHVVLHSFAHLSTSKAPPKITKELFDKVEERLKNADYISEQTPFGYFLDINVQAPGRSAARIFLDF